jgi:hypothetical protein
MPCANLKANVRVVEADAARHFCINTSIQCSESKVFRASVGVCRVMACSADILAHLKGQ